MKRGFTFLRTGLGWVVLVSLALGLVALFSTVARNPQTGPTALPTATRDPALAKIDPDLLEFIETGRQGTGKAQRYVFDDQGRIKVIIIFDRSRIPVSRSQLFQDQPAGRLIITYDGVTEFGIPLANAGVAFIPLDRVTDLANEETIVRIYPAERVPLDPVVIVTVISTAPSGSQLRQTP